MTLDDLSSFFNSVPLDEVTSAGVSVNMKISFDDGFLDHLVEFCKENDFQAAMISANRPILVAQQDGILCVSERNALEFEMDDLLRVAVTDEIQNDLDLVGRAEAEDLLMTPAGVQIAYRRIVSFEPGYPKAFYIRLLDTEKRVQEMQIERDLDDPFAGRHDGSVFEYEGFMNERNFDDALRWATERKSSDITVQPGRPIFARMGSEYVPITTVPINTDEIDKIVRHIYGPSGPAEVLGGATLDPAHEIFIKRFGRIRYRVNITGGRAQGGSSAEISLRTLPTIPIPLEKLEIEPELAAACMKSKDGLVLFTGPTGSGKSTTMSSFVRHEMEQVTADLKIIEFSAPIEYIYDGIVAPHATIWQTTAGEELRAFDRESIFALCVRNGMRRNPDIIIIGESRDVDTMQNTISAAQSGHLVLSTMHSTGVASTVRRAVNMFPPEVREQMSIDVMEQLRVICTQRLLPKRGGGRVAVREFMVFGEDIRELFIREPINNWPRLVRKLLAEERAIGQTMAKGAMKLLRRGLITEDVYIQTAARGIGVG